MVSGERTHSIFDPSSTLNPTTTIAFTVDFFYDKGPFPDPYTLNLKSIFPKS